MSKEEDYLTEWARFQRSAGKRILKGKDEFGNRMFTEHSLLDLCQDMKEEFEDLANYAYAGWKQVDMLEQVISRSKLLALAEELDESSSDE